MRPPSCTCGTRSLYRALRPLLFALDPESAHRLTLDLLRAAHRLRWRERRPPVAPGGPVRLMGLTFANRVGLAAGFDKSGRCVDALGDLGFGCIEVGTVTPLAQRGNARPRIERIPAAGAIINRMGFPNDGVEVTCARLARRRYAGICGLNIGKNASTSLESAAEDYVACLEQAFDLEMRLFGADGADAIDAYLRDAGSIEIHPLLTAWLDRLRPLRATASEFASLWNQLPLDDSTIANRLGVTREHVINLRKFAHARLSRRMAGW